MGVLDGELYVIGGYDVEKFDGTSWQSVKPGLSQGIYYGNDTAIYETPIYDALI